MEKKYIPSLYLSSFSISLIIVPLGILLLFSLSPIDARKNISAIFLFGDSYTDQGNNNYILTVSKCNFLPYGSDFMGGNRPTGRFSNGKTIADFMSEALEIKEFVPPYLDPTLQPQDLVTGVSFGSGSSGYDPQTAVRYGALTMSNQLKLFKAYVAKLKGIVGEDGSKTILANSIFLIICGTNDVAGYFTLKIKARYSVESYTDFLVDIASKFVQDLYALEARNIFVFGSPPVGCIPFQRTFKGGGSRNCSVKLNELAKLFNTKLSNALTTLKNSFNDSSANLAYVDYYNTLYNLIQNPTQNGFTVVDKGCCGTGLSELSFLCNPVTKTCKDQMAYIYWDSYHYTEHGNRALVNHFLNNSFSGFL